MVERLGREVKSEWIFTSTLVHMRLWRGPGIFLVFYFLVSLWCVVFGTFCFNLGELLSQQDANSKVIGLSIPLTTLCILIGYVEYDDRVMSRVYGRWINTWK